MALWAFHSRRPQHIPAECLRKAARTGTQNGSRWLQMDETRLRSVSAVSWSLKQLQRGDVSGSAER